MRPILRHTIYRTFKRAGKVSSIVLLALSIGLGNFPFDMLRIPVAEAVTCGAGTLVNGRCQVLLTTSNTSPWSVPADWDSSNNEVITIGAGGQGSDGTATAGGAGGGGGGYASTTNVSLTPGGTASFQIGVRDAGNGTGNDTWFS